MSALLGDIRFICTPFCSIEEIDAAVVSLLHAIECDLCMKYHKRLFSQILCGEIVPFSTWPPKLYCKQVSLIGTIDVENELTSTILLSQLQTHAVLNFPRAGRPYLCSYSAMP